MNAIAVNNNKYLLPFTSTFLELKQIFANDHDIIISIFTTKGLIISDRLKPIELNCEIVGIVDKFKYERHGKI